MQSFWKMIAYPTPPSFPTAQSCSNAIALTRGIMQIAGTNFQVGHKRTSDSYHFSRYPTSTGWATWRRAWQHFDAEFRQWPAFRDGDWLFDWLHDRRAARRWAKDFESQYRGQTRGWAICWVFTCWTQGALEYSSQRKPNCEYRLSTRRNPYNQRKLVVRSAGTTHKVSFAASAFCHGRSKSRPLQLLFTVRQRQD